MIDTKKALVVAPLKGSICQIKLVSFLRFS